MIARLATVGAAPLTTMSNSSLTESVPSLAVTFTDTVAAAVGVPEKVRVSASKLSQAGRSVPSDCAAV